MSDHEAAEKSPRVSVTSDEVAQQIRAVIDPPTRQFVHFCELMRELKNERANRCHEEIASFGAVSPTSGTTTGLKIGLRFETINLPDRMSLETFWISSEPLRTLS